MIVERTKNEILVRLPAYVDLTELQNMLEYLDYQEQTAKTEASQKEVDALSETITKNIWAKVKIERELK